MCIWTFLYISTRQFRLFAFRIICFCCAKIIEHTEKYVWYNFTNDSYIYSELKLLSNCKIYSEIWSFKKSYEMFVFRIKIWKLIKITCRIIVKCSILSSQFVSNVLNVLRYFFAEQNEFCISNDRFQRIQISIFFSMDLNERMLVRR